MKKRIILPVVIALALILNTTALAVTNSPRITPTLSFNGTTANCSVIISNSGHALKATVALYHDGTRIDSWSGSGNDYLAVSGSCSVEKGESYTLMVSYSVDGFPYVLNPIVKTC